MATQLIDFSIVRDFIYNGVNQGYSCIYLNGTRLWERYQIEEVYQEWVNSGYEEDVLEWVNVYRDSSGTYVLPSSILGESWIGASYFYTIFKEGIAVELTDTGNHGNKGQHTYGAGGRGAFSTGRGYQLKNTQPGGQIHSIVHSGATPAWNNSYQQVVGTQWVDTGIYVDKTKLTDMWYY